MLKMSLPLPLLFPDLPSPALDRLSYTLAAGPEHLQPPQASVDRSKLRLHQSRPSTYPPVLWYVQAAQVALRALLRVGNAAGISFEEHLLQLLKQHTTSPCPSAAMPVYVSFSWVSGTLDPGLVAALAQACCGGLAHEFSAYQIDESSFRLPPRHHACPLLSSHNPPQGSLLLLLDVALSRGSPRSGPCHVLLHPLVLLAC